MKVRDILSNKGNTVYTIRPDVTVYEALKFMADKNLGGLVVTEDDKVVGIFTERDYARKIVLKGKFSKDTLLSEIMHHNPITVTEDDNVTHCMNLMTNGHFRHLPVMRDEELIGIVSIGDVVKFIIQEQQNIIDNLDSYISGKI